MKRCSMIVSSVLAIAFIARADAQVILTPGAPATPAAAILIAPDNAIPLVEALASAQAALQACTAQGATNTVEVVDMNDNIKVLLSSDGAANSSFEYARKKAYTVIKKGISSGAYGKTLGQITRGQVFEGDANLIQYAGALPITKNGVVIGALSVSSSKPPLDEVCATAGMSKFHL